MIALSNKQLKEILDIFRQRMQVVTDEYVRRMAEQLRDIGEIIPSAETRLIQMHRMQVNMHRVQAILAAETNQSVADIAAIFNTIAANNARFAAEFYGTSINTAMMDRLKAQFAETAGAMVNLSQTTIDSALYRNAVDEGIQAVQTGIEDYNSAIRRAVQKVVQGGVRLRSASPSVEFPSGKTKRLDSVVRQNVLDGVRKLNQAYMQTIGETFGADGVEISAHMMCAEDHLPYQGRQYSTDDFAKLQASLKRPFGQWNCRHSWSPILMGISPPAYTPDELAGMQKNSTAKIEIDGKTRSRYQWTQVQRQIETAIRYQQDMINAFKIIGDKTGQKNAQKKIAELNAYYEKIVETASTPSRPQRMGTYYGKGYSKKET